MKAILKFAMALVVMFMAPAGVMAAETIHKVVIHVDQNDAKVMNLALNNVVNINKYYESKGEKGGLEVGAYGPGLHMFRADTSPVKARIETMGLQFENLKFSACGNTRRKMAAKSGKKVPIMSEASMVPSGVIRLIELQEKGYAYIRP